MARRLLALLITFIVVLAGPVFAQNVELSVEKEAIAEDIFVSTMSPFCVARSLKDCPSGAAHELKEKIRADLASGKAREDIMQGLLAQYGEKVRSVPPARGFGLFGWLAPLGFLVLGGVILMTWARMRTGGQEKSSGVASPEIDPEMQKRIDKELEKF